MGYSVSMTADEFVLFYELMRGKYPLDDLARLDEMILEELTGITIDFGLSEAAEVVAKKYGFTGAPYLLIAKDVYQGTIGTAIGFNDKCGKDFCNRMADMYVRNSKGGNIANVEIKMFSNIITNDLVVTVNHKDGTLPESQRFVDANIWDSFSSGTFAAIVTILENYFNATGNHFHPTNRQVYEDYFQ